MVMRTPSSATGAAAAEASHRLPRFSRMSGQSFTSTSVSEGSLSMTRASLSTIDFRTAAPSILDEAPHIREVVRSFVGAQKSWVDSYRIALAGSEVRHKRHLRLAARLATDSLKVAQVIDNPVAALETHVAGHIVTSLDKAAAKRRQGQGMAESAPPAAPHPVEMETASSASSSSVSSSLAATAAAACAQNSSSHYGTDTSSGPARLLLSHSSEISASSGATDSSETAYNSLPERARLFCVHAAARVARLKLMSMTLACVMSTTASAAMHVEAFAPAQLVEQPAAAAAAAGAGAAVSTTSSSVAVAWGPDMVAAAVAAPDPLFELSTSLPEAGVFSAEATPFASALSQMANEQMSGVASASASNGGGAAAGVVGVVLPSGLAVASNGGEVLYKGIDGAPSRGTASSLQRLPQSGPGLRRSGSLRD